jgi:hypothetical protein
MRNSVVQIRMMTATISSTAPSSVASHWRVDA